MMWLNISVMERCSDGLRATLPGFDFQLGKTFSSTSYCPDQLFLREKGGRGVKLTTHLHLVLRPRMVELHSTICLHGMVFD
jgi:hypothetical protein